MFFFFFFSFSFFFLLISINSQPSNEETVDSLGSITSVLQALNKTIIEMGIIQDEGCTYSCSGKYAGGFGKNAP